MEAILKLTQPRLVEMPINYLWKVKRSWNQYSSACKDECTQLICSLSLRVKSPERDVPKKCPFLRGNFLKSHAETDEWKSSNDKLMQRLLGHDDSTPGGFNGVVSYSEP